MFGLWYSIAGIITGIACSLIAKKKKRAQKNWYVIGQLFPIIPLVIVYILNSSKEAEPITAEHPSLLMNDKYHPSFINT